MRYVHNLTRAAIVLVALLLALPGLALAQNSQVALVGRALLPAATFADTKPQPSAEAASITARKTINGLKVPFDSQPEGDIVTMVPGKYPGDWYALTDGTFDKGENSFDFLLRMYTLQLSWPTANGGDGTVNTGDWITFSDPAKKAGKNIHNANSPRELSGADFYPRAARVA